MRKPKPCPETIPQRVAYSVREFACLYGISRSTVYEMLLEGTGPLTTKLRGRTVISQEAARVWQAANEGPHVPRDQRAVS